MTPFQAALTLYTLGAAVAWVRLSRWEPAWRAALAALWPLYLAAAIAAALHQADRGRRAERYPLWLADRPDDHLSRRERALRPLVRPGLQLDAAPMPRRSRAGLPSSFDVVEKAYGQ